MFSPPQFLRSNHSQYQLNTLLRPKKLPKLSKHYSSRDIDLVRNLSITESNTPLITTLMNIKNKQQIDSNPEIRIKRLKLRIEPSLSTSNNRLTELEKEFNSENNKEFYIKYEKIKKEKQMEDNLRNTKLEVENLKQEKKLLYEQSLDILNQINDYNLNLHVLDSEDYVLFKQREKEKLAMQIEQQEKQKRRESLLNNPNLQMRSTTRTNSKGKRKSIVKFKIDTFVLSTLNSRENAEKIEKKKEINKDKAKCYENLKEVNESISKLKEQIRTKVQQKNNIQDELVRYYHNLLYEGLDVRQEGLSWIIKAIWQLGVNVELSYLPTFLDNESIDYLFTIAHKTTDLKHLEEEIAKEKSKMQNEVKQVIVLKTLSNTTNNSPITTAKNLFQTSVVNIPSTRKHNFRARKASMIAKKYSANKEYKINHILNICSQREKIETEENKQGLFNLPSVKNINVLTHKKDLIEKELKKLKKEEMERLFKLFIEDDYERKNEVAAEVVLAALVGEVNKDREMQTYTKLRKNYFESIKKAEFFSITRKENELSKLHFAKFTNSLVGK